MRARRAAKHMADGADGQAGRAAVAAGLSRRALRTPGRHYLHNRRHKRWLLPVLAAPTALLLFIFALRMLVLSAGVLTGVLDGLNASGALNLVGLGWLGSYAVLSGSPIAATALTLLDAGVLSDLEAFAQIVGSRVGASFVVLAAGFVYFLRGQRLADSVHVGVVAFLVTLTTWVPVALLGAAALEWGWFDGIEIGAVGPITTLTDAVYDPLLDPLRDALPDGLLFVAGLFLLLLAFKIFDGALPSAELASAQLTDSRIARGTGGLQNRWSQSRWTMFLLGALVTLVTFSVAVSLTLLVPLALRGAIRRNAVIPYVLGANITTFADTLFASAALESGATGTVVVTTIILASAVALLVLLLLYRPYVAAINWATRRITRDRRSLGWFVAAIVAVPLLLLVL